MHRTVNHSIGFVEKNTGAYTKTIVASYDGFSKLLQQEG
jgi:hypothetical protein